MTTHYKNKLVDSNDFEFVIGQMVEIEIDRFGDIIEAKVTKLFYHHYHGDPMIEVLTDDGEKLVGCEYQAVAV